MPVRSNIASSLRRWSRNIHRELSFFFGGVILIYALSGFMLNHKNDFNSDYDIRRESLQFESLPTDRSAWDKGRVLELLSPVGEQDNYTKHYFPEEGRLKVFLKGGSSLVVDLASGEALYESVRKRALWSGLNRLHYNPGRWWTVFSDIFILSLVVITLTGLVMLRGPKGFWGRGGIEFLAGLLIPVAFLLLL